jgi:hypothetical protein
MHRQMHSVAADLPERCDWLRYSGRIDILGLPTEQQCSWFSWSPHTMGIRDCLGTDSRLAQNIFFVRRNLGTKRSEELN